MQYYVTFITLILICEILDYCHYLLVRPKHVISYQPGS